MVIEVIIRQPYPVDQSSGLCSRCVVFFVERTEEQAEPSLEAVIEKGFAFCNVTHYNEYILTVWS